MFLSVLQHPEEDIFFTSVTKVKLFWFEGPCLLYLCFVLILRTHATLVVVVLQSFSWHLSIDPDPYVVWL